MKYYIKIKKIHNYCWEYVVYDKKRVIAVGTSISKTIAVQTSEEQIKKGLYLNEQR